MNHLQPSPQRNARVRSECRRTALSEILERAIGPHLVHFRYGCRPILAPPSPRPRQSASFMDFCNSPPAVGPLPSPPIGPFPSICFTCGITAGHSRLTERAPGVEAVQPRGTYAQRGGVRLHGLDVV